MEKALTEDEIKCNYFIVTFMGISPRMEKPDVYSFSESPFFMVRENNPEKVMSAICKYKRYSTSWGTLMPVVHKCLAICHNNMLNEWEESFGNKFMSCSIDAMYKEVVDFIIWVSNQTTLK
jgi:chorismate synthase